MTISYISTQNIFKFVTHTKGNLLCPDICSFYMKETLREVSTTLLVFLNIYTTLTITCFKVQSSRDK